MKLVDYVNVPVFLETVVAVDLHLIGLAVVVTLYHLPSMVYILSILMPYSFYEDLRSVWLLGDVLDVFFEFLV